MHKLLMHRQYNAVCVISRRVEPMMWCNILLKAEGQRAGLNRGSHQGDWLDTKHHESFHLCPALDKSAASRFLHTGPLRFEVRLMLLVPCSGGKGSEAAAVAVWSCWGVMCCDEAGGSWNYLPC